MTEFPWLTAIGVVPLIGSLVVALLPKSKPTLAKQIAMFVSLLVLGHDHRDGAAVRWQVQRTVPVRGVLPVDPRFRRELLGGCRRHRIGPHRTGSHPRPGNHPGRLATISRAIKNPKARSRATSHLSWCSRR